MNLHDHFDRLTSFLLNLECLDCSGQRDAVINEIIETGGTYTPARPQGDRDTWGSHLFEISLHGVYGSGQCEDEAIRNWKKVALTQIPALDGAQKARA